MHMSLLTCLRNILFKVQRYILRICGSKERTIFCILNLFTLARKIPRCNLESIYSFKEAILFNTFVQFQDRLFFSLILFCKIAIIFGKFLLIVYMYGSHEMSLHAWLSCTPCRLLYTWNSITSNYEERSQNHAFHSVIARFIYVWFLSGKSKFFLGLQYCIIITN
jgi:hypothetical protein